METSTVNRSRARSRRVLTPVVAAATSVGLLASPALAITGGQPDGDGHPYTALLLEPGAGFCSGALIDENTILTAGHCTVGWESGETTIMVSFDPQASVTEEWEPDGGVWYEASTFVTHPGYVDDEWPYTYDYGLVHLDEAITHIEPADLPDPYILNPIIDGAGQTKQLFDDVGYGIQGANVGGGPPSRAITWTRKIAVQQYAPGKGGPSAVDHETWFVVRNVPSKQHGGACGGDSGSPVLLHGSDTIVAVHTGGYSLGYDGVLCGRMSSLNHRIDLPEILTWIEAEASANEESS